MATKKKRDWKTINAKRATAVGGKEVSRYMVEQVVWLRRYMPPAEFAKVQEKLIAGTLTVNEAVKDFKAQELAKLPPDMQQRVRDREVYRNMKKHWQCMCKVVRDELREQGNPDVTEEQVGEIVFFFLRKISAPEKE
jgi:hypothetical protein